MNTYVMGLLVGIKVKTYVPGIPCKACGGTAGSGLEGTGLRASPWTTSRPRVAEAWWDGEPLGLVPFPTSDPRVSSWRAGSLGAIYKVLIGSGVDRNAVQAPNPSAMCI